MESSNIPFVNLKPLRKEIKDAVKAVLERGVFMNGEFLKNFISEYSNYLNIANITPTANCTDALEIILRAYDIQKGDEVITSAFSWFSDASVVKLVGADLVFCDVDLSHFGIQVEDFKAKITTNTKVLILPHLFGMVHPDVKEIYKICQSNNIQLIEDCAQAHGATQNGKMAGTFGDISAFSFYPTKNLAALGDAGCIACDSKDLAEECTLWANHGQSIRNQHHQLGRNSRMDELQAAVLLAQLPFLNIDNEKRRELADVYFQELDGLDLVLPMNYEGNVYHQFVIRTNRRDELKKYLREKGIETDIHYPMALSDMTVFDSQVRCRNASLASKTVLSLPIHPNHSEVEVKFVANTIHGFFTN